MSESELIEPRRRSRWLGLAALAVTASAYSVAANLSCSEILTEVDGIVHVEDGAGAPRIVYAERAAVSQFFMRWPITYPLRWPLGLLFGATHTVEIPNPPEHVRELLRELPDETGGDLVACAAAASRFDWLAEFDDSEQSRIVAVDGLARVALQLALPAFGGDFEQFGQPPEATRLGAARAGLQVGRPDARGSGGWDEVRRRPYLDALVAIVERRLEDRVERVRLVEDLTALFAAESDAVTRLAVAASLRAALVHMVEGTFADILHGRAKGEVELRLVTMEQVRRLGGVAAVPFLLALMAATPEQLGREEPRFDSDELIQLRLVHYCGQLRGARSRATVRLPGQKDWDLTSPIDFLVTTILNEQAYYSKLRTPALVALSWCLGRQRSDPDPTWVRQWNDAKRPLPDGAAADARPPEATR